MKRCAALLLVMLLLTGCSGAAPVSEDTQTAATPVIPQIQLPEVQYPVPVPQMVTINEAGLTDEEILLQRRDIVEAEMRNMMGVLWTPAEDITYSHNDYEVTLKAGRVYRGMPYSHGSGSGYTWLQHSIYQQDNGVHIISVDGSMMTGTQPTEAVISNDCADSLFWAWAKVSTSISFPYTQKMSSYTGCVKVGDYKWDDMGKFEGSTKPILQENGEQVMYKAYSQLQKGDGMVLYTKSSGGHAVMVCEAVTVMNGKYIDGEKSYVRILEQISSNLNGQVTYYDEELGVECYAACGYDDIWTFETIYNKGYLPITCKELIDPAPLAEQVVSDTATTYTQKNMYSGRITSPYRISGLTYTIYDQEGRAVQQATYFVREKEMFDVDLYQFENSLEQDYRQGAINIDALPNGTFKCVLTCQISTGSIIEVRSFDITR